MGAKTFKLDRGHRGANQPVKNLTTGKVEITSQNHGFAVDLNTLPETVTPTHVSLFDGSNEGLACTDRPAFSVQYHPEASPGPSDSHYLSDAGWRVYAEARKRGAYLRPLGDTVYVCPPLNIGDEELETLLGILEESVRATLGS